MKILFISSGNTKQGISIIIKNQGESIKGEDVSVEYYTIKGKGIIGYGKHIFLLRKFLFDKKFDLFHAHYSLSAFTASLAGCRPLVVSLMGSDVNEKGIYKKTIYFFSKLFWKEVIVKSEDMVQKVLPVKSTIIPNGVNLNNFIPDKQENAKVKVGFTKKQNVIFISNPARPEKNYQLAKDAVEQLNNPDISLHTLFDIPNEELMNYYNAADCLLMTSWWEGSPNVIKEAMACNCPIVATDVGDIKWVLGEIEGCFITSFKPEDIAKKVKAALDFGKRTKGRERIIELGLDSVNVACNIKNVYKKILDEDS